MEQVDNRSAEISGGINKVDITKVNKWAETPRNRDEKGARKRIEKTIGKDLERKDQGKQLSGQDVLKKTNKKLLNKIFDNSVEGGKTLSIEHHDSETHNINKIEVGSDTRGYFAREVAPDGTVFTEAIISRHGETTLTLKVLGEENQDMNPGIEDNHDLQEATVTTFNLLAAKVFKGKRRAKESRGVDDERSRRKKDEVREWFESEESGFGSFWNSQIEQALEENPERFGNVGRTYVDTLRLTKKIRGIKESGDYEARLGECSSYAIELQKAYTLLHQELGIEDYEVVLDEQEGEHPRDKAKRVIDNLLEDNETMQGKIVKKELEPIIELRAEYEFAKDEILSELDKESQSFDRREWRNMSYEVHRRYRRWVSRNQAKLRSMGRGDAVQSFDSMVDRERDFAWGENEQDQVKTEIGETNEELMERLRVSKSDKDYLDVVPEESKSSIQEDYNRHRSDEEIARELLRESIEHHRDANEICEQVDKLRWARFRQDMDVSMAEGEATGRKARGFVSEKFEKLKENINRLGGGWEKLRKFDAEKTKDNLEFSKLIQSIRLTNQRIDKFVSTEWGRIKFKFDQKISNTGRKVREFMHKGIRSSVRGVLIINKNFYGDFVKGSAVALVGELRNADIAEIRENLGNAVNNYREETRKRRENADTNRELVVLDNLISSTDSDVSVVRYKNELQDLYRNVKQKLPDLGENEDEVEELFNAFNKSGIVDDRKYLLTKVIRAIQEKQETVKENTENFPEKLIAMPLVDAVKNASAKVGEIGQKYWELNIDKTNEELDRMVVDIREKHRVNPYFRRQIDRLIETAKFVSSGPAEPLIPESEEAEVEDQQSETQQERTRSRERGSRYPETANRKALRERLDNYSQVKPGEEDSDRDHASWRIVTSSHPVNGRGNDLHFTYFVQEGKLHRKQIDRNGEYVNGDLDKDDYPGKYDVTNERSKRELFDDVIEELGYEAHHTKKNNSGREVEQNKLITIAATQLADGSQGHEDITQLLLDRNEGEVEQSEVGEELDQVQEGVGVQEDVDPTTITSQEEAMNWILGKIERTRGRVNTPEAGTQTSGVEQPPKPTNERTGGVPEVVRQMPRPVNQVEVPDPPPPPPGPDPSTTNPDTEKETLESNVRTAVGNEETSTPPSPDVPLPPTETEVGKTLDPGAQTEGVESGEFKLDERLYPENFWKKIDKTTIEKELKNIDKDGSGEIVHDIDQELREQRYGKVDLNDLSDLSDAVGGGLDAIELLEVKPDEVSQFGERYKQSLTAYEEFKTLWREKSQQEQRGEITTQELLDYIRNVKREFRPKAQEILLLVQEVLKDSYPAGDENSTDVPTPPHPGSPSTPPDQEAPVDTSGEADAGVEETLDSTAGVSNEKEIKEPIFSEEEREKISEVFNIDVGKLERSVNPGVEEHQLKKSLTSLSENKGLMEKEREVEEAVKDSLQSLEELKSDYRTIALAGERDITRVEMAGFDLGELGETGRRYMENINSVRTLTEYANQLLDSYGDDIENLNATEKEELARILYRAINATKTQFDILKIILEKKYGKEGN